RRRAHDRAPGPAGAAGRGPPPPADGAPGTDRRPRGSGGRDPALAALSAPAGGGRPQRLLGGPVGGEERLDGQLLDRHVPGGPEGGDRAEEPQRPGLGPELEGDEQAAGHVLVGGRGDDARVAAHLVEQGGQRRVPVEVDLAPQAGGGGGAGARPVGRRPRAASLAATRSQCRWTTTAGNGWCPRRTTPSAARTGAISASSSGRWP